MKALHFKPRGKYFKDIVNAHRVHHSVAPKEGAFSFGFLYAPKKYATMKLR